MEKICCILDFDGFNVHGKFFVRELGYIGMNETNAHSISFDLTPYGKNLKPSDRRTIDYVYQNITGLPFLPLKGEETIPLTELESKVRAIYEVNRTSKRDVVAFKGGQVEKNLLSVLGIPYMNLEDLGCPKFDDLMKNKIFTNCGNHVRDKHCPLAEVTAFKEWLLRNYNSVTGERKSPICERVKKSRKRRSDSESDS